MNYRRVLAKVMLVALVLLLAQSPMSGVGRRGGGYRGGGFGGGGNRGGSVVGPYGGGGYSAASARTVVGPTRTATTGSRQGSYTTNRGTTINYAGAGTKTTGPAGVTRGGAVGGVQVTGAGGQTYTKAGAARGAVGPGGAAVGSKASVSAGKGPGGSFVSGSRTSAAIGPHGAAVSGSRGVVATGPNGLSRYTAAGRVGGVGFTTHYVGASTLQTRGVYVRSNFVHYNCFTPNWYVAHPVAWRPVAWTTAAFWTGATWGAVASACAYPPVPVVYDYGTTVVYQDNSVYYEGAPVASAEQYVQQAAQIAGQGQAAKVSPKEEWIPLGVFAMVQGDEKDSNNVFQLAINKGGIIRGNYYNGLSDTTVPVYGSVDKKTQRAAWTVGDRKETVYETGVANLTQPQATMLVHFGKDRTQQWTLVRLEPPKGPK